MKWMKKGVILSLVLFLVAAAMLLSSAPLMAEDAFFEIQADKPSFSPSSITVKKGQKVTLKFVSLDVDHGVHLKEFGLPDTKIPEKGAVTLEFTPDKTGTFSFPCTVYCSWRHLVGARPRIEIKVVE